MDNHYDELEDDQLIDLDYIGNRNQDEPHMLDEHRPNLSSKNTYTTIINPHNNIQPNHRNNTNMNNQPNPRINTNMNNRPNPHNTNMNNRYIQHNQHNQNKITKKIFINTFYISLLAIIGLCINVFSYNDIIHNINNTNINSDAIIKFNFNINNAYYYILITLALYVCYIGATILIFVCWYFINITKINIIRALYTNNILYTCIILLRIIQFYIFTIYILNDTYILQVHTNKTITINNTVNVYIPLYIELSILDTILHIFIFYMIGKTTGIINVYNKYSLQ